MDTRRLVLFVIFSFSIMMLWDAWQQKNHPKVAVQQESQQQAGVANVASDSNNTAMPDGAFKLELGQRIKVSTDLFQAEIDTVGGDLRRLTLNKHLASNVKEGNFVLMDDAQKPMLYIAQTGLLGANLPNHKSVFTSTSSSYTLADGADSQQIRLSWSGNDGITVDKVYTFHRNSYLVDVNYEINNGSATSVSSSAYYQIVHDSQSKQGSALMPTFTGGAYFTDTDKFTKVNFADMEKEPLSKISKDGWIGVIEHYFASAWIVGAGKTRELSTKKLADNIFAVRAVLPAINIAAGAKTEVKAKLFAGPQTEKDLAAAAPGLEYAVDYGWLTVVAKPLFWVL